jgi:hypothetical protein
MPGHPTTDVVKCPTPGTRAEPGVTPDGHGTIWVLCGLHRLGEALRTSIDNGGAQEYPPYVEAALAFATEVNEGINVRGYCKRSRTNSSR